MPAYPGCPGKEAVKQVSVIVKQNNHTYKLGVLLLCYVKLVFK